ncbi:MAG TPA: glutamate--tRNA ligase [Ardenticatenaceae bacterium]|jgi:glutamyl-tRNA synthetase
MSDTPRVRTRYAPSPTGLQHLGGARSALFPWLWARHNGGDFILRIEDTDQARFRADALADIFDMMAWLGLDVDEGPLGPDAEPNEYFQTQHAHRYQEEAQRLIQSGHAYYCYCSSERLQRLREQQIANKQPPGYDRHCRFLNDDERAAEAATCEREGRNPVVRLAVPLKGETRVKDAIRDESVFDNSTLEDIILLKSDSLPTYHLAHIVDDHDMRISHAMRGSEYLPTFPLHIITYEALGWEPPLYVHLPLILNPNGKGKLSKRKQSGDGAGSDNLTMVYEFREAGYLPEAFVNYIALLGWSFSADEEIATLDELVEKFNIYDIKVSPSAMNYEKLEWMNGYYIRQLPVEELAERVAPFLERAGLPTDRARLVEVLPLVQERMKLLSEGPELLDFFLADAPTPSSGDLPGKKMDTAMTVSTLEAARSALGEADWSMEGIEAALRGLAEELELKPGQLFQPIRVAITGRTQAPGIFETVYHVGREAVLSRLERAIGLLRQNA